MSPPRAQAPTPTVTAAALLRSPKPEPKPTFVVHRAFFAGGALQRDFALIIVPRNQLSSPSQYTSISSPRAGSFASLSRAGGLNLPEANAGGEWDEFCRLARFCTFDVLDALGVLAAGELRLRLAPPGPCALALRGMFTRQTKQAPCSGFQSRSSP